MTEKKNHYDYVIIGSSIIAILEAVYLDREGKSVLIIDESDKIGGAWKCLDLFNLHNVENAVHYLLNDKEGIKFMKSNLKWNIVKSKNKYRVFKLPLVGYIKLQYDGTLSRILDKLINKTILAKKENKLFNIKKFILDSFERDHYQSFYIENGSPEILKKTELLLKNSSIKIAFNTVIEKVVIDEKNNSVMCDLGNNRVTTEKIVFTHGSKINRLEYSKGRYEINKNVHPRPALHLLINDNSNYDFKQCIFVKDSHIKYIHDITEYTDESEQLKAANKKLFVLALQHDIKEDKTQYNAIFSKMIKSKIIGDKSILISSHWSDIYLPELYDEDLYNLKETFKKNIEILRTENFSRGIGYYSQRWSKNI